MSKLFNSGASKGAAKASEGINPVQNFVKKLQEAGVDLLIVESFRLDPLLDKDKTGYDFARTLIEECTKSSLKIGIISVGEDRKLNDALEHLEGCYLGAREYEFEGESRNSKKAAFDRIVDLYSEYMESSMERSAHVDEMEESFTFSEGLDAESSSHPLLASHQHESALPTEGSKKCFFYDDDFKFIKELSSSMPLLKFGKEEYYSKPLNEKSCAKIAESLGKASTTAAAQITPTESSSLKGKASELVK